MLKGQSYLFHAAFSDDQHGYKRLIIILSLGFPIKKFSYIIETYIILLFFASIARY